MGGNSSRETSISRPYYGADTGGQGRSLSKEEEKMSNKDNKAIADRLNQQYRNENPDIALLDDAVMTAGVAFKVAIGLAIGYLGVEVYKAYKTK